MTNNSFIVTNDSACSTGVVGISSSSVFYDSPDVYSAPAYKSVLHISPEFLVYQLTPKPNRWYRFWYRILLGWTWSDVS
jgi:hypothetical protein